MTFIRKTLKTRFLILSNKSQTSNVMNRQLYDSNNCHSTNWGVIVFWSLLKTIRFFFANTLISIEENYYAIRRQRKREREIERGLFHNDEVLTIKCSMAQNGTKIQTELKNINHENTRTIFFSFQYSCLQKIASFFSFLRFKL